MLDSWNTSSPYSPVPESRVLVTGPQVGRGGPRERGRASDKVPQHKMAEPGEKQGHHRREGFGSVPGLELHTAEPPGLMTLAQNPSRQVRCLWPLGCPWAGVVLERDEREGSTLGSHSHGSQVGAPCVPSQLCPGLAVQRADSGDSEPEEGHVLSLRLCEFKPTMACC